MKLSHDEFWAGVRESAGLYSRSVRLFKREYGVDITRIAVRARALRDPEQLKDIREQNLDIAEEGLHSLMRTKNENVKLRAIELYLKHQGGDRGWDDKHKLEINEDMNLTIKFI